MSETGWFATSRTLATTGVTSIVNLDQESILASTGAENLKILNTTNAGVLVVAISGNGDDYSNALRIATKSSETFLSGSVKKIKVKGSANSMTFSLVAWRGGAR